MLRHWFAATCTVAVGDEGEEISGEIWQYDRIGMGFCLPGGSSIRAGCYCLCFPVSGVYEHGFPGPYEGSMGHLNLRQLACIVTEGSMIMMKH